MIHIYGDYYLEIRNLNLVLQVKYKPTNSEKGLDADGFKFKVVGYYNTTLRIGLKSIYNVILQKTLANAEDLSDIAELLEFIQNVSRDIESSVISLVEKISDK